MRSEKMQRWSRPRAAVSILFPDAVQRVAHKGAYARLRGLCGAVLRRSGIVRDHALSKAENVPDPKCGTIPGLQRSTSQELRAAQRPGKVQRRARRCVSLAAARAHDVIDNT